MKTFTNDAPNPLATIDAGGAIGETIKIVQLDDSVALSLAEVQVFESSLSVNDFANSTSASFFSKFFCCKYLSFIGRIF